MVEWHPSAERLEVFMMGQISGEEGQRIVRHLLGDCPSCQKIARAYFPCDAEPAESSSLGNLTSGSHSSCYSKVFEKLLPDLWNRELKLEVEKALAPESFGDLQKHPFERRILLVENCERYRTWSLCEYALDEGHSLCSQRPTEAVEALRLGAVIAERLDDDQYTTELTNDIRARAHYLLANALRISSELEEAEESFKTAAVYLSKGSGDPKEHARFLSFKGALFAEFHKFKEANQLLDKAIATYRRIGETHEEGRALMAKGMNMGYAGNPEKAVEFLRQALELIDEQGSSRLVLAAKHNLVYNLYACARYHQALALVPETRALHSECGKAVDLVRFGWLEGLISSGHGELDRAESAFLAAKKFFVEEGMALDVALVSLDLALVFLRQRRTSELKALSTEMLGIFRRYGLSREAIAALVLFQKAVELEKVSFGLIRDLAAYLKNSQNNPHLRFRPSSSP